jgi:hypothetical protein
MAKALAVLASEIDSWSNSPNKDAIKKGSDAAKYVGYLLNAADFVVAAKDMELSIDNLNASNGEATVNAWADSIGNLFDKAGGLIDLIPDGAVPGFFKSYWKGLFSAPKNYIAAFKTIMKEHYDIVNEEGHVNTGDGEQAYNLGTAETEWRGRAHRHLCRCVHAAKKRDDRPENAGIHEETSGRGWSRSVQSAFTSGKSDAVSPDRSRSFR